MNLTDEQAAEEVRLIKMEQGWPLWPLLPMKNTHRHERSHPVDQSHGIVLAERPTRVYLATLGLGKFEGDWRETMPHLDFDSIEDMVRAGWIGD